MLYRIKTVDGTKKKVPLAGSTPAGLPVGSILSTYKKIQPYNYLYCDGSTFDETQYPELYLYLGTNVLPDYRECVQVGAEKNTTNIFDSTETNPSTGLPGTQSHDVFSQGEFKDDQIQNVEGTFYAQIPTGFAMPSPNSFQLDTGGYPTKTANASMGEYAGLGGQYSFKTSRVARSGITTRTKEKAVYYYIKAVDGVDIANEDTFLNTVVNTIQDAQSYSTTEQKTGGKWIDGKDIYRRVFYSATNWASGTTIGTISNLDMVTEIKDLCYSTSDTGYLQNYGADGSGSMQRTIVRPSTGAVVVYRGNVFINNYPSTIIVEYTKNE